MIPLGSLFILVKGFLKLTGVLKAWDLLGIHCLCKHFTSMLCVSSLKGNFSSP